MTTPSDHPPAIPPIGVRLLPAAWLDEVSGILHLEEYPATVPLGLSPEQPVRCGGGE